MKKVVLLFSVIMMTSLLGCVKEKEQPIVEYKYSVEVDNEIISNKRVDETVSLSFLVKTEYDFENVPMKYKVETNKNGLIKNGEETILSNEVYTLSNPNLNLSYTGKEAGEHTIKVTFFNDNTKETTTKEFKLKYIKDNEYIPPKLEIKELTVNSTITAYIRVGGNDSDGVLYDNFISNVSNTKINIQSGTSSKIQKIKIEIPTIEGKFEKEYTFTGVQNLENTYSETLFHSENECSENPQSSFYPCTVNKKYIRSNINEWITTKPKAKVTIYDNKGNYISQETYIDFTLNIGKEKTENGLTYDM